MRRLGGVLAMIGLFGALSGPASSLDRLPNTPAQGKPGKGSFELIGHEPLMNRGMNAAIAVKGDYAYVGSRTDGTHPNAGIMVVDVSDPSAPEVVHQIGPPEAANRGETTREMRIWPQQDLLVVLNLASNCSYLIHECSPESATKPDVYRFFDIRGDKAAAPELIAEYRPSIDPHEFYLWVDPKRKDRALMFQSTPSGNQQLLVTDISKARAGKFGELATWSAVIPDAGDNRLHSLSISPDGRTGYVAYLEGGFFMIDTSDLARGVAKPEIRLITPLDKRAHWGEPGAHSAVPLWGSDHALVTDEVYGRALAALGNHGCPWGWTRIVDISDPRKPKVVSEYKLEANSEEYCDDPTGNRPDRDFFSSWSAHNPTLTPNLAFISWHSGGLQAVDISDPTKPKQAAVFSPEPLPAVVTEDPILSSGLDKVVMWSYPVIQDGLIYVSDIRNGLYIVAYEGPFDGEVSRVGFLEGNSNLGDALRFGR